MKDKANKESDIDKLLSLNLEPKKIRKTIYISNEANTILNSLAKGWGLTQIKLLIRMYFQFRDDFGSIRTDIDLNGERNPKTKLIPEGLITLMNSVANEFDISKEDALELMIRTMYSNLKDKRKRTAEALKILEEWKKHTNSMIEKVDKMFNDDTEYEIIDRFYLFEIAAENLSRDMIEFVNGGPPIDEVDSDL